MPEGKKPRPPIRPPDPVPIPERRPNPASLREVRKYRSEAQRRGAAEEQQRRLGRVIRAAVEVTLAKGSGRQLLATLDRRQERALRLLLEHLTALIVAGYVESSDRTLARAAAAAVDKAVARALRASRSARPARATA